MKRFSIIKRAYVWLFIGGALLAGALVLFFMNARFSEEFTGGVKIKINKVLNQQISTDLQAYLQEQKYENTAVGFETIEEITSLSIRVKVGNDEQVNKLSKSIQEYLLKANYISTTNEIIEQSITGPSVGEYMKKTARNALIIGLIFMAIYMMFSFATIRQSIPPTILAAVTIVTMIFDVAIPAGAYGFWMMINNSITIDTVFIIAVLTNMGYSINDTIIIFDRIRENIQKKGEKVTFGKIFDDSLWQTMRRSFGTVVSTLVVVVSMYIFGSGAIQNFAFTVGIGILAGSYSSIFISAPLAYILMGRYKSERKHMLASENK